MKKNKLPVICILAATTLGSGNAAAFGIGDITGFTVAPGISFQRAMFDLHTWNKNTQQFGTPMNWSPMLNLEVSPGVTVGTALRNVGTPNFSPVLDLQVSPGITMGTALSNVNTKMDTMYLWNNTMYGWASDTATNIPLIKTKLNEIYDKAEDTRAQVDDLSGGASEMALTLSGVSQQVDLALGAAERIETLVENPNLQTAVDMLAADGTTLLSDVRKTAILVNNVNTIANKLPQMANDEVNAMLDIAPAMFEFVANRTNMALDNMEADRHASMSALLTNTQTLMSELKGNVGPNPDLSPFIELFNRMPASSQAITGEALLIAGVSQAFVDQLGTAKNDVSALVSTMNTDISAISSCSALVERRAETELQSTAVIALGVGLKLTGAVLQGVGSTYLRGPEDDAEFGIHGYTSIKIKNNWAKKLGSIIKGIGDGMINVASLARSKTNACASQLNQEALQQRFVDVVGDGAWTPGEPLDNAHTLAGIGDGVANATTTLATIDGTATAIKTSTDQIPAIGGKIDTILGNTGQTLQYTSALPGIGNKINTIEGNVIRLPAIQASTDQILAIGGHVSSILSNTSAIPALTNELAAVKSTVESNSAALSYVVDLLNSSPGLGNGANAGGGKKPSNKPTTASQVTDADVSADTQSLWLRVQIEQGLMNASQSSGLAIFYRPESLGGHLEFVRVIVNETIEQNVNSGYDTGNAMDILTEGDAHLISGYYKEAWLAFGRAYREAL